MASIIDTVANLAKRRGLVYQSGEIYGGTKSAWDYGPLGVELKENIKRQWWRSVVTGRDDVVGLDSAIVLPREVWVASGHVEVFNDPLVESLDHATSVTAQTISSRPTRPSMVTRRRTDWPTSAIPRPGTRGSGPSRAIST